MASNMMADCCTVPLKHKGDTKGTMISIGEIDTYVAEPESTQKNDTAIIILTDGFGVCNNSKLLADSFATAGYFTVVPDLFEGDPFPDPRPATFNLQQWLNDGAGGKGHLMETVDPIVDATISWLRNEKHFKRVGAAGYCFGGKYTVRYLRPSSIDVGFIAHPTNTTAEEVSTIDGPLSIAAAEKDVVFIPEKRFETEELLRKNPAAPHWQVNLYSGVGHGFAARGDKNIRVERWAMEQAFRQALSWMDEHLVVKV